MGRMAGGGPSEWTIDDLHLHLMGALELELLTLPPYLTALYSLKSGANEEAADVIRSVAMEEMLHLALAANVLNAVGGKPDLVGGGYVPRYPAALPFHTPATFEVGLLPFGEAALDVFLAIENPTHPGVEPPPAPAAAAVPRVLELAEENGYETIGAFYGAIQGGLKALDAHGGLFSGDPARQIQPGAYHGGEEPGQGGGELLVVTDLASALVALSEIVDQGEGDVKGGPAGIFDADGKPAHFYRLKQLRLGRRYAPGDSPENPTGAPIEVDFSAVQPMKPNLRAADLSGMPREAVDRCNETWVKLLGQIQEGIDGKPNAVFPAVRTMLVLRGAVASALATPLEDGSGLNAGPTFEFAPPTA